MDTSELDKVLQTLQGETDGNAGEEATGGFLNLGSNVNLDRTRLDDEGVKRLVSALQGHHFVRLSLEGNILTDASAESLATIIAKSDVLGSLNLAHNKITGSGAQFLADAIKSNPSLQLLDLSFNSIGDEGAEALGEALRFHSALRVLRLCRCRINDDGAYAVVSALVEENSSVQELDMGHNGFGSDVLPAFAAAIGAGHLASLALRHCDLRHGDIPVLFAALPDNTALREVDLRSNKIGDTGALNLAGLLRENEGVVQLDLKSNKISSTQGYKHLALALSDNTTLLSIALDGDDDDTEGNDMLELIEGQLAKNALLAKLAHTHSRSTVPHGETAAADTVGAAAAGSQPTTGGGVRVTTPPQKVLTISAESATSCDPSNAIVDGVCLACGYAEAPASMGVSWVLQAAGVAGVAAAVLYVLVKKPGCPAYQ